jgi:hypothetical protein
MISPGIEQELHRHLALLHAHFREIDGLTVVSW